MSKQRRLLIVGGGISGVSAAESARYEYPDAKILLYSSEPYSFYNKIALGSFITGKKQKNQLSFYPENWIEEKRIDAQWGISAFSIDTSHKKMILKDGNAVKYDKLILAVGAVPKLPPIEGIKAPGVFTFWSLGDAVRIRYAIKGAKSIVIIGAGILGVEAAVELASKGLKVTLVEQQKSILPMHLNSISAQMYNKFLASKKIKTILNASVTKVVSHASVSKVFLSNNRQLKTDVIMLMAGVEPQIDIAQNAGIKTNNGIIVNSNMNTSNLDVLACGNCVEFNGELFQLWNSSKKQGEVAGINAFENKLSWKPDLPIVHVKTPHMPLFIAGSQDCVLAEDTFIEETRGDVYRALCIDANNNIKYAIFLKDTAGHYEIEKAIKQKLIISNEVINSENINEIIKSLWGAHVSNQINQNNYMHKGWVCQMCGYSHEGDFPPEVCPVCAVGKDQFLAA